MAKIIALITLFALVAVAFAAPAEEKKENLQTASSIGLGYGLYGGLGYGGLGYGGLYGGYGIGYGGLGYGGLYGGYGLYGGLGGYYG